MYNNQFSIPIAVAGIAGAFSVLAWAPFGWWWAALLGYGLLFWLLTNSRNSAQACWLGFVFGLGLHVSGHGWVTASLYTKVGMSGLPAALGSIAFMAYMASFSAVPAWLWHRMTDTMRSGGALQTTMAVLAFCSLLTVGEWLRSLLFNGFTSLSLGYALIDTWLDGYVPLFGLYGVSWIGYGTSALVALTVIRRNMPACAAILLAAAFGSGLALREIDWVQPAGPPLGFRLIQSNVKQEKKFDPSFVRAQVDHLAATIQAEPADLIVTAETAFPVFLNELPPGTLSNLQQFSTRTASHLFLGIATEVAGGNGANSVVHIRPGKSAMDQYNKVRLMPFGEYSPIGFGWFTGALHIPLKDLTAGTPDQLPFTAKSARIGALICHEDLTGQGLLRWLPTVTLLLNPSNLAWFEGSLAIEQRLQIVRMRARESGRPILRVTNAGITAHVDHAGRVLNLLPEKQNGVVRGQVQPMQGSTPYSRLGDYTILLVCGLSLSIGQIFRRYFK